MARFTATLDSYSVAKREARSLYLTVLENGEAADLTGATLVFEIEDTDGEIVVQKVSTSSAQIEIDDNVGEIKFVGGDTEDLDPGAIYNCDAWVHAADGEVHQIIARQRFRIAPVVYEPDTTPPDPPADMPLAQSNVWRRFLHTWESTGDSATIAIPGSGMVDGSYAVTVSLADDNGGGWPSVFEFTNKSVSSFDVECGGSIAAGATLYFILEDA